MKKATQKNLFSAKVYTFDKYGAFLGYRIETVEVGSIGYAYTKLKKRIQAPDYVENGGRAYLFLRDVKEVTTDKKVRQ